MGVRSTAVTFVNTYSLKEFLGKRKEDGNSHYVLQDNIKIYTKAVPIR